MRTLDDIVGVGACEPCRGRITKCSAERPACSECVKRSTACTYFKAVPTRSNSNPRPDPHSPRKPKSAYVLFGEHVRKDPALSQVPPADIEKSIQRRWTQLSQEERVLRWEQPVSHRMRAYQEELERYKQTENYQKYQIYLEAFNHRRQSMGNRRPSDGTVQFGRWIPSDTNAPLAAAPASLTPQLPSLTQQDPNGDQEMDLDIYEHGLEGQPHDATSPVKCGMSEVRAISKALGINPHTLRVAAYPSEEVTTKAIEDFLGGTGSLIYLWDREGANSLIKAVYDSQNDGAPIHAAEVFAMAAVGSYCDGDLGISYHRERFLEFFICLMSLPSAMCDLRRMRLFACLAICRFTNNVLSARKLMLAALNIGRQMFISPSFHIEHTEEERRYWWNIFRSILFLESWFAYNTNHESRVTGEDLTLYKAPRSNTESGPAVFQDRLRELGQLAAYIALDLKDATKPKGEQARTHLDSLNKWHRTLPPPMQLSRLSLGNPFTMKSATKRSLLQSHILFLGIFIEPYRNCLVDLGNFRLSNAPIEGDDLEGLQYIEEQCVLAARQSARVASLLQFDSLVRAHCWISMYTSFTGCAILLFSASQKLLALRGEEIGQDLSYASSHLNLLSLCSYDNNVARDLYKKLQLIFNDIREAAYSPVYRKMCDARIIVKDPMMLPRNHYDAVEGAEEVSRSVVDATRRAMFIVQEALMLREH